jgi:hypothetical protein
MKAIHENNFWDVNPELKILEEFSKVYEKDKSKAKQDSSTVMWGIYYAYHPESKFYNLPGKLDRLKDSFIKQKDFKWDNYTEVIITYKEAVLTDAERALSSWGEIMSMRDRSLKKLYQDLLNVSALEVDTKSLKEVDSMLANTPKMFEDYKKIKKDYEEEKTQKKGKRNKSLSDSDDI